MSAAASPSVTPTVTPTVDERTLEVGGTFNLRDLGGLPTVDGRVLARRRFLRSGSLAGLSSAGRAQLDRLGVRSVVDLRTDPERSAAPDALVGSAAQGMTIPLLAGAASSMVSVPTLHDLYRGLLDDEGAGIVESVRVLLERPGGVLVHCSAGKDRTGVVVALVLLALGVDRDDVLDDYTATERFLPASFGPAAIAMARQVRERGIAVDDDAVLALATRSPRAALAAAIDHVDDQWGSAAGYLWAHGLPDDGVDRLRARLLA
ncbi:tyrosine-protein phosphatase [Curtobacterium sp. VKM Ac-2865]|uniref:tyrosine-protein phosphatase n=1 Tax=Curtobacterium sp. VKM Ac-2865 TaxID=2783817 RepID=UPI00188AB914|nr:tyrosine-protein phosphatase [Curtobacterium sp. VKM Ac-2865]MBF4582518.1 tyrosine-protein phosphatase [Curtobacterium sp. VKM Ac-2865]